MTIDDPIVGEFLEAFRPRVLPIYLTLTFLIGWLGLLSVHVLFEPTEMAAATVFVTRVELLMFMLITIPFVEPLAIAAGRCWSE